MMITRDRVASATIFLLIAAVATLAVLLLGGAVAHAQSADPVTAAQASTATLADLMAAHGPVWGPLLFAFGLLSWGLAKNGSTHWIAQGRKLAIITGASLVLEAVLRWQLAGGTLESVLSAIVMAGLLITNPFQQAPVPRPNPAEPVIAGDPQPTTRRA